MIKTENPFPAVCGRVCNKRCESECTRGKIDAPVSIDAVKKFVADLDLNSEDRFVPEKIVQSTHGEFDEKIAIIGGGPAGLSAAYYLAQMGYKPTVFEKNPIPGGMLTYGIPSYKLEKDVIAAEIDHNSSAQRAGLQGVLYRHRLPGRQTPRSQERRRIRHTYRC